MYVSIKLTVFFEDPFWVGVFENNVISDLYVCRVVFGSEPKDYEVYEFISKNYYNLKFSRPLKIEENVERKINPKRLQKEVKKETENRGIGTAAQIAMKLQQEMNKVERKVKSREEQVTEKQEQFDLRQQKLKEKHKGH